MSTDPKPRRRWLQFGLKDLFWLLLAVALAVYGIKEHRSRRLADNYIRELHPWLNDGQPMPYLLKPNAAGGHPA